MSSLLDRLNRELEEFGRRAQSALDEGKLQIELLRARRQQDGVSRDFGLLVHRRERGHAVESARIDALMLTLDDLDREITALERRIAAAKGDPAGVEEQPAPAASTSADAPVP